MNLRRLWAMTRIGIRGHILNPFWHDSQTRRRVRRDVIGQEVPRYFKRYLPAAAAVEMTPVTEELPEKFFSVWGWNPQPPLVDSCFESMRKNLSQDVIILDDKTLFDYIDLPDFIIEKRKNGQIETAHFMDIARIELLYKYGGYWLDSTGFVTGPIPSWITDTDFFVFLTGDKYGSPYSFAQNCFIHAKPGSYLLAAWRAMVHAFWKNEHREFDYFMHQLLFKTLVQNDPRARAEFKKMPHVAQDATHKMWADYHDKPFDQKLFDKLAGESFFHKTTYRDTKNMIPGSFAEKIVNMYKDR